MAPPAVKRTALEENRCTDARTIMNGEFLDVKYNASLCHVVLQTIYPDVIRLRGRSYLNICFEQDRINSVLITVTKIPKKVLDIRRQESLYTRKVSLSPRGYF